MRWAGIRYFCTYFDSNYLARGMALYRSLQRHARPFSIWVLCLDDLVYDILTRLALPDLYPISMSSFELGNKELLQVKSERSRIDYYLTCSPCLPLYVLTNWPEVDLITYIDADLFFFSDPFPIYEELGDASVLIIGHRFAKHLKQREVQGLYNVGFICFRRDKVGLECLRWWRDRCLESCQWRVENGQFGEQKYLDDWPTRFDRVVVAQHRGANLGPWNLANYSLTFSDKYVMVDSQRLIFFHFTLLRRVARWLYDPGWASVAVRGDRVLRQHVYGPYISELEAIDRSLSSIMDTSLLGATTVSVRKGVQISMTEYVRQTLKEKPFLAVKAFLRGQLLVSIGNIVL